MEQPSASRKVYVHSGMPGVLGAYDMKDTYM